MNLKQLKDQFIDGQIQIVLLDNQGTVTESDDAVLSVKKGKSITETHPFFFALLPLLDDLKTKVSYPCVNLEIDKQSKIVDITLEKVEDTNIVTFIDFTEHYNDAHPIVQEKNEASIQKNKLYFEHALLEAKGAYKNQFISQLNHEIRNPLNNLLGFIDILKETQLDYQQEETLNVIQKTGKHIKYLMDDLLDISKIETGTIEVKHIPFNLYHIIKNIETHFGLKRTSNQIDFTVESTKNIPAKLTGDPLRLNQILFNLIENAFRNTTEGAINVTFDFKETSKTTMDLIVHINDTGIGIPEDKLDNVFDSYYRLKLDQEKPIGQGLGLKIVKDLTELLKGKVTAKSEEKKGSQFTVAIPFDIRDDAKKKKTVPKGSGIVISKRILVIEDEEINQMLFMKNFLNNDKGFHIEIATSAVKAIARIEEKSYYAIIVKSTLQQKSTIPLLQSISQHTNKRISNTPVLVVTGNNMLEQQEAFLMNGASAFLAKPYTKTQLFKKLETLHDV